MYNIYTRFIFINTWTFLVKAMAKHMNVLIENHQSLREIKICAYSCTWIVKSSRQNFLCTLLVLYCPPSMKHGDYIIFYIGYVHVVPPWKVSNNVQLYRTLSKGDHMKVSTLLYKECQVPLRSIIINQQNRHNKGTVSAELDASVLGRYYTIKTCI